MYCPTSILKPFFIIWSSIVLKGWMTTYGERDKGKKGKKKSVFTIHWIYLHPSSLTSAFCYVSKESRWNFVPSRTGSEEQHLAARRKTAEGAELLVEVFFHTVLAVTQKGTGQTGTSCATSPDVCMHIVNSRCTLHSGTEHSVNEFGANHRAIIQLGNWINGTTGNRCFHDIAAWDL